ncbi:hypothetical protein, membrane [gut metagenome]|uniref:DUF3592 domain-containing protein n=1 Tax=gut metagenome TaxID=749906 RepID=J9GNZ2_9ZZZZ
MKSKITAYLTLVIGCIALVAVGCRLYHLQVVSQEMIHTSGTIARIDSKREYRSRKSVYKLTASLEYKVNGRVQYVRTELHYPFLSEGSTILLWYHPLHTHKVILPSDEYFLWGIIGVFGLVCFLSGAILIKSKE